MTQVLGFEIDDLIARLNRASPQQLEVILPAVEDEIEAIKYDWSTCDRETCDGQPHDGKQRKHARPNQIPPEGNWSTYLLLAGRGFGKTRAVMEWLKKQALSQPNTRWAIVAPTYADARDTCIEGVSGLIAITPPALVKTWNRSLGELDFVNGSRVKLFSADEPDRLRGPQHHGAVCDELAAWKYPESFDQLLFGLRLGEHPQVVIATTPRPTKQLKELVTRDSTVVVRGSTYDNAANLSPSALEELRRRYEGTRLGRQELLGEILTDVPGALWTQDTIDAGRRLELPQITRRIIGIDPADGDEKGDGYGVSGASLGVDGHAYVEFGQAWRNSPNEMALATIELYHEVGAGALVIEKNHGGKWIPTLLRKYDPTINIIMVTASEGKITRAEPIAALFCDREDFPARAHILGFLDELEEQLTSYTGKPGQRSPDVLDAMVWALTELLLGESKRGTVMVD